MEEGEVYLFCGKCKNWNLLIGGHTELNLSGEAISERLNQAVRVDKEI